MAHSGDELTRLHTYVGKRATPAQRNPATAQCPQRHGQSATRTLSGHRGAGRGGLRSSTQSRAIHHHPAFHHRSGSPQAPAPLPQPAGSAAPCPALGAARLATPGATRASLAYARAADEADGAVAGCRVPNRHGARQRRAANPGYAQVLFATARRLSAPPSRTYSRKQPASRKPAAANTRSAAA